MPAVSPLGVLIESGVHDWQVFQQDGDGACDIAVGGRWIAGAGQTAKAVGYRLVSEATNAPPRRHLDWAWVEARADGAWEAVLRRVPAGGLYRLETHLRLADSVAAEWNPRGDMRHFLGVGDLWIVAGQSNSAGYGKGPMDDGPELGVHSFNNAQRWTLATQPLNESTDTAHPANREAANPGQSPWLAFARRLRRELNHPVGLIQTSLGGSPLVSWNPTEPGEHPLYEAMVQAVRASGNPACPPPRGVVWYQGESDANPAQGGTYFQRFSAMVAAWRQALARPDLAFITVQLNRYYPPAITPEGDLGWTQVREAQRQVANRVPAVAVVPTFDLPLSDLIHTGPFGNLQLAERAALAALGLVHGRDVAWEAPQPSEARAEPGGRGIRVTFAPVTGRIDNIDVAAQPFRVEDGQGVVPVDKVQYPGDHSLVLVLGRELSGPAQVHGGWGIDPPCMPQDMGRWLPVLGFHGLPVTAAGQA